MNADRNGAINIVKTSFFHKRSYDEYTSQSVPSGFLATELLEEKKMWAGSNSGEQVLPRHTTARDPTSAMAEKAKSCLPEADSERMLTAACVFLRMRVLICFVGQA